MQDRAAGDTGAGNIAVEDTAVAEAEYKEAAENRGFLERSAEAVDQHRPDWRPVLPAAGSNFVRP